MTQEKYTIFLRPSERRALFKTFRDSATINAWSEKFRSVNLVSPMTAQRFGQTNIKPSIQFMQKLTKAAAKTQCYLCLNCFKCSCVQDHHRSNQLMEFISQLQNMASLSTRQHELHAIPDENSSGVEWIQGEVSQDPVCS